MKLKILDKYIAKNIITSILMVAFALLALDIFLNVVNEIKVVGRGQYTLASAFSFLALTAPSRMYSLFPWAALLGSLISLSMMAKHRELVVMRTASISVSRITWSVVKAACILIAVMMFMGEAIAPHAERYAQTKKTLALSGGQSIQTQSGLWVRQGLDFIHVYLIANKERLHGVTRYQFDEHRQLKAVSFAKTALKKDKHWILLDIEGTQFLNKETKVIKEDTQIIDNLIDSDILETAMVKHPERLSLPQLWRTIQHRSKNELNANAYELAFYSKLSQPILIILMVVLAIPFVFGPLRAVSMGVRIVAGVMVAYGFHILNGVFAPVAVVYQVPPIVAVILPLMIFAAVGFGLLLRVK